jgi:hypothetical protein
MPYVLEGLVEEAVPQVMPHVSEQRIHGSAFGGSAKPLHAASRGEVSLNGLDRRAKCTEILCRIMDGRRVGSDQ